MVAPVGFVAYSGFAIVWWRHASRRAPVRKGRKKTEMMDRRDLIKLGAGALLAEVAAPADSAEAATKLREKRVESAKISAEIIEQWELFEARYNGPSTGNPFVQVSFGARFTCGHRSIEVDGFYDGGGVYKVRFSPDALGQWSYETTSNAPELAGKTGVFTCIAPATGNHGPVGVAHQFHFQYADGRSYYPFGTTCYAYAFIEDAIGDLTLTELQRSGFNKVRFCLLPKPIVGHPTTLMPFAARSSYADAPLLVDFDVTRPNPAYFAQVERRIAALGQAGIEADVILFHPYDPQCFSAMDAEADDRYLRYAVARFAAYRNVWWSIANEYDLVKSKSMTDWDRFFRIVQESDPYARLRSIHHSKVVYDHAKHWCTHASLQEYDFEKSEDRRRAWNKPILYDEIQYEGNIERRWGNLSPEEMTHRFWRAIVNGVYATHGETYMATNDLPAWTDAGKLRGASPARIAFLRKLLEETGTTGLTAAVDPYYLNAFNADKLYLWYFDDHCVGEYTFPLPEKVAFKATLIDPWEMTKTPLEGKFSGKSKIKLPGKAYRAVLFEKI